MKKISKKSPVKNSFYMKMLFLYSGILLLSAFISTCILYYTQRQNQLADLRENNQNFLTQFQIYTDHYVLDRVYSLVTQELYNNSLYNNDLLFNPESYRHDFNDHSTILEIQDFLNTCLSDAKVIHSIYIYCQPYDTLVSTEKGNFYSVTDNRYNYQDLIPYQLLDYALQQKNSMFWIPPSVTASFYSDQNIATLARRLPTFVEPSQADLILLVNLDLKSVYEDFLADSNMETNDLLILEGENLLYSASASSRLYDAIPASLSDALSQKAEGSVTMDLNSQKYLISWMGSQESTWTYVYFSACPDLFLSVFTSTGGVFFASLSLFLLCLLIIYLVSNWLYRPIGRMIQYSRLMDSLAPDSRTDELTALDMAFRNMSSHIDRLQQTVDRNNSLLLSNTIKELVNGNIHSRDELNEQLQFTGEFFPHSFFYLILIKIDESAYDALDYQKRSFLQLSIVELLNASSFDSGAMHTKALSVFHHSGTFTTVVNADSENGDLMDILEDLLNQMTTEYGNLFNMAVSRSISDFNDFNPVRNTLLGYFKYYYIYGNHNIFTEERIAEYERDAAVRAQVPLKILTAQIRKHDGTSAKQEISALFETSRDHKNSLLYTYNLALQIINVICMECENLGIQDDSLSHAVLVDAFTHLSSLDSTVSWFHQVIDSFMARAETRSTALDATVIPSVLEYMTAHVDGQLSLNSVADQFGLSTGHLSRLFKEKTGTNFSDHLISLKLETAARMLLEDRNRKVSEISDALGYSNISYFNKMFKEHFGATPTQYRKMNLNP